MAQIGGVAPYPNVVNGNVLDGNSMVWKLLAIGSDNGYTVADPSPGVYTEVGFGSVAASKIGSMVIVEFSHRATSVSDVGASYAGSSVVQVLVNGSSRKESQINNTLSVDPVAQGRTVYRKYVLLSGQDFNPASANVFSIQHTAGKNTADSTSSVIDSWVIWGV